MRAVVTVEFAIFLLSSLFLPYSGKKCDNPGVSGGENMMTRGKPPLYHKSLAAFSEAQSLILIWHIMPTKILTKGEKQLDSRGNQLLPNLHIRITFFFVENYSTHFMLKGLLLKLLTGSTIRMTITWALRMILQTIYRIIVGNIQILPRPCLLTEIF